MGADRFEWEYCIVAVVVVVIVVVVVVKDVGLLRGVLAGNNQR